MELMPVSLNQLRDIVDTGYFPLCATADNYCMPTTPSTSTLGTNLLHAAPIVLGFDSSVTSGDPYVTVQASTIKYISISHGEKTAPFLSGLGACLVKLPEYVEIDIRNRDAAITPSSLEADSVSYGMLRASINTQSISPAMLHIWSNFGVTNLDFLSTNTLQSNFAGSATIAKHVLVASLLRKPVVDSSRGLLIAKNTQEYINRKKENELSYTLANKYLWYNPEKGRLTWKISPDNALEDGDEAGFEHSSDQELVKFRGHVYRASRVAWLLHNKSWPEGRLIHLDGDPKNIRWTNLKEV